MTIPEKYANSILDGSAGELAKLAAERFIKDINNPEYFYDIQEVDLIVRFFDKMIFRDLKWDGKSMRLQPWQHFLIANLYGLKTRETGRRKYRRGYVQVARKNGKTSLWAGLGLYHISVEPKVAEPWAIVGANDEKQAKICTSQAWSMIENQGWQKRFRAYQRVGETYKVIHRQRKGKIEAITKQAQSKDGSSPSLALIDEFHEAKDPALLNVLRSGQGARPNPLTIIITTAGFNKSNPCYSLIRNACIDVLRGHTIDEGQFALIYEPDHDDDWNNRETWKKSNPMYEYSETLQNFLEDAYQSALTEGGTTEVNFKTKNLNIWSDSSVNWIPDRVYISSSQYKHEDPLTLKDAINLNKGKKCYAGLDLASISDFNAFSLYFPENNVVLPFFWVSQNQINGNDMYMRWQNDGYLYKSGKEVIDFIQMFDDINKIMELFQVVEIGYDPYKESHGLITKLHEYGAMLEKVQQSFKELTSPTQEVEKLIRKGSFEHYQNPILRWMFGNVELMYDGAGNIKPDKKKSQNKIDGVVSTIMAVRQFMADDNPSNSSLNEWLNAYDT